MLTALTLNGLVVFAVRGGEHVGVLGGPDVFSADAVSVRHLAMVSAASSPGGADKSPGFVVGGAASLSNKGAVLGGSLTKHARGVLLYKVQEGDNLSQIAAQFGISVQTILWANDGTKAHLIRPGDELTILPASGVLHKIKIGDTVTSLAASFGVEAEEILAINRMESPGVINMDDYLVIPGGKPLQSLASLATSYDRSLPSLSGFFAFPMPANSWNWGVLHRDNAIDIANVCGTSVYAAAEGLVVKAGNPDRWNSGYGGYVVLEHANGTETLYSHTQENFAEVGDFVNQGATIAEVGSTGNVHGRTGCHLHFEVEGARNPFAK